MPDEHKCALRRTQEEELYPKLAEIMAENRGKPENLIMVLHKAQNLFGYLPKKVQQMVAEGLGLSLEPGYGVMTFYSFFSTSPKGRNTRQSVPRHRLLRSGRQQALAKVEEELEHQGGRNHGRPEVFPGCGALHRSLRPRPCHTGER